MRTTKALAAILFLCCAGTAAGTPADDLAALHAEVESLIDQGNLDQAEAVATEALQLAEKNFGLDHGEVARCLDQLGWLQVSRGHNEAAEPLFQRSLEISEEIFGLDHPATAERMIYLAGVYGFLDRTYDSARLYRHALRIKEETDGPEHPEVIRIVDLLALQCSQRHKYWQAEGYFRRSLETKEKYLDPDNPAIGETVHHLAGMYFIEKDYDRAEPLYRRALAIREQYYGMDHPEVAVGLNNLGLLYGARNEFDRAERVYLRSLEIRENAFGPNHPDVVTSRQNIARLYRKMGRRAEAAAYEQGTAGNANTTPPAIAAKPTSSRPRSVPPVAKTGNAVAGPYQRPVGQDGWALHVYSLPDEYSANETVAELHRRGYRTETRKVQIKDKGRWHRIYLGSFKTKAEAKSAMGPLLKRLGEDWASPTRF